MKSDIFLLVLANVIWGTTDVVAKLTFSEMSPVAVAWTRLTIALMVFAPLVWRQRSEIPRTLRGFSPFILLGACGFFLNMVIQYEGLLLAPASHATALKVTESLVIMIFSGLFLRERLGVRSFLAVVSGMIGVYMVLNVDIRDLSLFTSGYRLGDLLIIGGIIIESLYTVFGKRVLSKTGPLMTTALACFCGWAMLGIFYGGSIASGFVNHPPSPGALLGCAYLGVLATAFCHWTYYRVLSRRASHKVGISIMLQPAVGIPLAAVVFNDQVTGLFIAGAALIATGVYIALGKD